MDIYVCSVKGDPVADAGAAIAVVAVSSPTRTTSTSLAILAFVLVRRPGLTVRLLGLFVALLGYR